MKLLLLFFLIGCAAAVPLYNALDDEAELVRILQGDDDDETKTELGKLLKERLDYYLEKIKDTLQKGKQVKEEYFEKVKEYKEKLEKLKIEISDKGKDLLNKLRDTLKDTFKDIFNKFKDIFNWNKGGEKRSVDARSIDIAEFLRKIRDAIKEHLDAEKIKEIVEKFYGKGSKLVETIVNFIKYQKEKFLDFIDRYLGKDEEKRSLREYWEKIKEFFKDVKIDIHEKYMKFGQWVKEIFKNGLDKTKDKLQIMKDIAREVMNHAKDMSKEVAEEAREFLRPYKEDLGSLWYELKDAVDEILNRKD